MSKILGSKWTTMERTFGWRHFRAVQKKREGSATYVLLVATCDEQTQFWVDAKNLKDRSLFAAGWLQKSELSSLEQSGAGCRACSGTGAAPCPVCSAAPGAIIDV